VRQTLRMKAIKGFYATSVCLTLNSPSKKRLRNRESTDSEWVSGWVRCMGRQTLLTHSLNRCLWTHSIFARHIVAQTASSLPVFSVIAGTNLFSYTSHALENHFSTAESRSKSKLDRWSLPLLWRLSDINAICNFWLQLQILVGGSLPPNPAPDIQAFIFDVVKYVVFLNHTGVARPLGSSGTIQKQVTL